MTRQQQTFLCCLALNKKIEWPLSVICVLEHSKKITLLYVVNSCNYWNSKPSETIRNYPQSTESIRNHSETTRNYSLHRNPSSLETLCFSPCWLWTIREVELRKMSKIWQWSWITNGNCGPFLTFLVTSLKQRILEWDCITYKFIQVSTFDLSAWSSDLWFSAGFCE